jgi:hypothetical protein
LAEQPLNGHHLTKRHWPKLYLTESLFSRTPFGPKIILPQDHLTKSFFNEMIEWYYLTEKKLGHLIHLKKSDALVGRV